MTSMPPTTPEPPPPPRRSWYRSLLRGVAWLGENELPSLIVMILIAAGLWGFVALADEVVEGDTHAFDRKIILSMRTEGDLSDPLGPHWLEELGRDFTALGGVGILTAITLFVCGYLLMSNRRRVVILVLVSVGGGLLISTLLKEGFDRARPDLVPHGAYVYTASFPSGHSMMSAATYLTLGALLARIHRRRTLKAYFLIIAALLTVAVGVSRVYLGVHWPTDVLAGWTLGAAWALLCWLVARFLQRRGEVERPVSQG